MTRKPELAAFIAAAALLLSSCEKADDVVPASVNVLTSQTTAVSETTIPTTAETEETTTTVPPVRYETVSIAAVGDNLIHSSIYKQAQLRSTDGTYDFEYAYENVEDIIGSADLAIINQETLICNDEFQPSTYPCFNSPTQLGNHMIDIGFDVFTIANNHTLDKGTDGLNACLDYWDSKENVTVAGAYRDAIDRAEIRTNEVNGVTFSYLSYTESLNGLYLPAGSVLEIGDANDIEAVLAEVGKAAEIADVCVVSMHWGVENSDVISDYQRSYAKQLIDAGADIIIGNHPHVLRDIEKIERDDGSFGLCAYSLGNFISAQSVGQNLIGGILQLEVTVRTDDEEHENPEISDIKLVPIVTHYDYDYADVRIYTVSEYTPELAEGHGVKAYSKFSYEYIYDVLEKNISEEYLAV